MSSPRITLDQWSALVAVVEAGGYAQASSRLHRTQSTVTYTIKKLEDLLEREGLRAEGSQGRTDADRRGSLSPRPGARRRSESRSSGPLPNSHAAGSRKSVWPRTSSSRPGCCSNASPHLDEEHPQIRIELIESVLGGTEDALTEGRADLAIGGIVPGGFLGDPLMQVRFVCAAAPVAPAAPARPHADARRPAPASAPRRARLRRAAQPQRRLAQRAALDGHEQGDVDPGRLHGTRLRVVSGGEHSRGTRIAPTRATAARGGARALRDAVPRLRGPGHRRPGVRQLAGIIQRRTAETCVAAERRTWRSRLLARRRRRRASATR